ncbi:hypothetical protein B5G43_02375 [Flavonifractor sp. An92]|uniref:YceD family protein n=1 Tax=Flavonifractor sp. An92 TaxID=1965666 RepID=UPI000B3AB1B4|nr:MULTISPECIES: DUF177 domain-containing protein [unclassified Flavonifractor]OUN08247.1 hypothetical protein B5G43_02375 [Flavonifractor sp. An92]OUQ25750.1 hypothetical protein B5E80_03950 [Flavonifractor sp. An135]
MRLNLRDLIRQDGGSVPFSFSLDLSDLDFFGARPIAHPVEVTGTVSNRAGALVLQGEAVTTLELNCDRCLRAFSREMRVPVDTLLAEELEDEENDEIVLLEDGEVDLDEVFTTAVVLAMDVKHVCSEDCKGLCPTCGANLNDGPCKCRPEIDPRFAALAQLLDKKESDD